MEPTLKLSDQEHRCFWELFNACDGDGCGVLPGSQVYELFLSSGISTEVIHQIFELSGAKRLGHFGRGQFFVALKLVAAAQNNFPVVLDICSSGIELPLPRFAIQFNSDQRRGHLLQQQYVQTVPQEQHFLYYERGVPGGISGGVPGGIPGGVPGGVPGVLPATAPVHLQQQGIPVKGPRAYPAPRSLSLAGAPDVQPSQIYNQEPDLSTSPRTEASIRKQSAPVLSHLPPPTITSVPTIGIPEDGYGNGRFVGIADPKMEKGWTSFEDDSQGLLGHDRREWAHFTDSTKTDTSSMSSAEGIDDVWSITEEQREYYINQFRTMQDDVRGVISGAVAKEFFEKSKLPVQELSKIWQLSDVNRDGVLSLDEFCTAMHLVVLRRNDIDLPDVLPPALMPYGSLINSDEPFAVDLQPGTTMKKLSPSSSLSSQHWNSAFPAIESPTSSSVSSPGNKPTPVNFEFKPITADPDSKIVHPVAVRMSPDSQPFSADSADENAKDLPLSEVLPSPGLQTKFTDILVDLGLDPAYVTSQSQHVHGPGLLHGRPRPTPKKAQSLPGPAQDQAVQRILPPPPIGQELFSGDRTAVLLPAPAATEGAPPPPPRLTTGHSRSSSLDNQLIDLSDDSSPVVKPPLVPPRPSSKERNLSSPDGSASERRNSRDDIETTYKTTNRNLSKRGSLERRDLQASIRIQKERNQVLSRLNSELNQELQEVMEQRIALEIQMEHLQG